MFSIGLAVGFCLGSLDHLGYEFSHGETNVLLINNEDDEDEIDRRIYACCQMNGLDYKQAKKRLYLHKPPDGSSFVAFERSVQGKISHTKRFLALKSFIRDHQIGLVIFDPLADIHHASENDNSEMAFVMKSLRGLARGESASIMIVHHTRKPDAASSKTFAGDPFSSRGASAIHGAVRVLVTMCAASEEDGYEQLGVSPPHHLNYSRLDVAKGSYSPAGQHTRWYECKSFPVGPKDCKDTAPALRVLNRSDQVQRMIRSIHGSICSHKDLFDIEGKMPVAEAVEIIVMAMPETDSSTALKYLEGLFRVPQTVNGVTLTLIGKNKQTVVAAT